MTLRNVVLTLPGDGSSTIVVAAARDASRAPAAASSAAATGVLVELARALGERQHQRTFVLASVSGSATGATGMRELIKAIPDPDTIEAVIVISQPGSASPRPPYVVGSSSGQRSAPVQLELTAERAVETQTGRANTDESAFTQLARLAIPSGLGDQAPLIGEGVDAIAVSSAGERTLPADDDQLDDVDPRTIDEFGRAIQTMIGALDVAVSDPVHGPTAHVEVGRNLVPGWALAALALALILPAAVGAVDACARSMRERLGIRAGLAWGAACSLPFVGGLAILYALVVVGLVPRPPFPFDPALYSPGARGAVTLALVLIAAGASVAILRFRRRRPAGAPPAGGPALGAISSAACFALWLANPYMALLLAPAAHALAAHGRDTASGGPGRPSARRADHLRAGARRRRRGRNRARARWRRALDADAHGRRRPDRTRGDAAALLYRRRGRRHRGATRAHAHPPSARLVGGPQIVPGWTTRTLGRASRPLIKRSRASASEPIGGLEDELKGNQRLETDGTTCEARRANGFVREQDQVDAIEAGHRTLKRDIELDRYDPDPGVVADAILTKLKLVRRGRLALVEGGADQSRPAAERPRGDL